jgi:hypothetical protein
MPTTLRQISHDGVPRGLADGHESFLVAFASHPYVGVILFERVELQATELTHS